ncbi:DNA polymerase III subunit delta' [Gardnerella sp. KA00735]|uniref:DNA polymerase III subunit delta' n=1 Tax=Gardnerella sp. KA00735 TaxID=1973156 RepID=UPI000C9F5610|nr:DNA polymerase III subunit delta' [Gardnerella sp. KA00735]PNP89464.1 DNA polymerase III subunit delta' [Gardnerella sp. KA00735]
MSVWDCVIGQPHVVDMLKKVVSSDKNSISQCWLICGPSGSGRDKVARAFAAALESEDLGEGNTLSKVSCEVLADLHPDVNVVTCDKVTITIDEVRDIVALSSQMPSVSPWRIIIVEDISRMLDRTTNVLLKEIEEPSKNTMWIVCASSEHDVLPTIRSRMQVVNLSMPDEESVSRYVIEQTKVDPNIAKIAARISQGNIDEALLYASNESVRTSRDELIAGILRMNSACDAIILAGNIIDDAKSQAEDEVQKEVENQQKEFRRINGLSDEDRIPTKLRSAYAALSKKDEIKRKVTRKTRDSLNRSLDAIDTLYRDVLVILNNAQSTVQLINQQYKYNIENLAKRFSLKDVLFRIDAISDARRRLACNGNTTLDCEALLCSLI